MGVRWPRKMFGVEIIYIRDYIARKVVSIVPGGRGVWALLPDGRVGTNDRLFFNYHRAEHSQDGLRVAEILWRLGKMTKREYQKRDAAWAKDQKKKNQKSAASDFAFHARQAGIALTPSQREELVKFGVRPDQIEIR